MCRRNSARSSRRAALRACLTRTLSPAPQALGAFARVASESGHRFESFTEPAIVRDVLQRNVTAVLENNLQAEELAELRRWIRTGDTPVSGDGLWSGPMNQPPWQLRLALRAPRLFLLPGITAFARARYLHTQAGTRHVAILRGPFQSWPELVAAGRMLMRLWLSMTGHGVYMLPFGSMITNVPCNRYLRERFAAADLWFILRSATRGATEGPAARFRAARRLSGLHGGAAQSGLPAPVMSAKGRVPHA